MSQMHLGLKTRRRISMFSAIGRVGIQCHQRNFCWLSISTRDSTE